MIIIFRLLLLFQGLRSGQILIKISRVSGMECTRRGRSAPAIRTLNKIKFFARYKSRHNQFLVDVGHLLSTEAPSPARLTPGLPTTRRKV
jgi:hypothetical protein